MPCPRTAPLVLLVVVAMYSHSLPNAQARHLLTSNVAAVPERRLSATEVSPPSSSNIAAPNSTTDGASNSTAGSCSVIALAAGGDFFCALKATGSLVCWGGANQFGEATVPAGLGPVTAVAARQQHTCALLKDGTVVCWGANDYGQATVPSTLGPCTAVTVGTSHTCVITVDGKARCWGNPKYTRVPSGVWSVTSMAAGDHHTCAVHGQGQSVACWGEDSYGETKSPWNLGAAASVAVGDYHSCAILVKGGVRCWGDSAYDQTYAPAADLGTNVTALVGTTEAMCAIALPRGNPVCWGSRFYYEDGQWWYYSVTNSVPPGMKHAVSVAIGPDSACAALRNGVVRCWSYGSYLEAPDALSAPACQPANQPEA